MCRSMADAVVGLPTEASGLSIKARVAQLVEHLTRNEKVAGSIPASGSKKIMTTMGVVVIRQWFLF